MNRSYSRRQHSSHISAEDEKYYRIIFALLDDLEKALTAPKQIPSVFFPVSDCDERIKIAISNRTNCQKILEKYQENYDIANRTLLDASDFKYCFYQLFNSTKSFIEESGEEIKNLNHIRGIITNTRFGDNEYKKREEIYNRYNRLQIRKCYSDFSKSIDASKAFIVRKLNLYSFSKPEEAMAVVGSPLRPVRRVVEKIEPKLSSSPERPIRGLFKTVRDFSSPTKSSPSIAATRNDNSLVMVGRQFPSQKKDDAKINIPDLTPARNLRGEFFNSDEKSSRPIRKIPSASGIALRVGKVGQGKLVFPTSSLGIS